MSEHLLDAGAFEHRQSPPAPAAARRGEGVEVETALERRRRVQPPSALLPPHLRCASRGRSFIKSRFNPANYYWRPKKSNAVALNGLILGVPFEKWPWEYRPLVEPRNVELRPTDAIYETHSMAYRFAVNRAGLMSEDSVLVVQCRFGPDTRLKAMLRDNYVLFKERPVPKDMKFKDEAWNELYEKR